MAIVDLIQSLVAHEVEFIIVGGIAAVLQGAPVNTLDLDVVYGRSPSNVERLLQVLARVGAVYRDGPRRLADDPIAPGEPPSQAAGDAAWPSLSAAR